MTASTLMKTLVALLFIAVAPAISVAQALYLSVPTVEMSALVPPILLVSIDDSLGHSMVIVGLANSGSGGDVRTSERRLFELRDDGPCDLGTFKLFSNIPDRYKISILSQNGALLIPSWGGKDDGIPYRLKVGGAWAAWKDGTFVYIGTGKTPRGGLPLRLELLAQAASSGEWHGQYSDSLVFAVSVE
jgi:hypothetical protein